MNMRAYKLKKAFQVSRLCAEANWPTSDRSNTHHCKEANLHELLAFSYSTEKMTILCSGRLDV